MSDIGPTGTDGTQDAAGDDGAPLAADPLTAGRLEKHLARLAGDGYPYRFERTSIAAELHESHRDLAPESKTGAEAAVAGRIMLLRSFGRLVFATLRDGSGTIQLFVDQAVIGADAFADFGQLELGDWVGASGEVVTTKRGELSVRVAEFSLLQPSLRPLPDKWHGLTNIEQRSRRRYLDLMVNDDARRTALTRATVVSELRRQFEARGYIEVETPILLAEATGALARPFGDTSSHSRHGYVPADRHRAVSQETRRRRPRARLRDRSHLQK